MITRGTMRHLASRLLAGALMLAVWQWVPPYWVTWYLPAPTPPPPAFTQVTTYPAYFTPLDQVRWYQWCSIYPVC